MNLVSDIVRAVRDEFGSSWNTRYADDKPILRFINQALERLAALGQKHRVPLFKARRELLFAAGSRLCPLPENFGAALCLCDGDRALRHVLAEELAGKGDWATDGNSVLLAEASSDRRVLVLWYWPLAPRVDGADPSPWGGRLDTLIAQYAALLLKNVDEFELGQDAGLQSNFEQLFMARFMEINPVRRSSAGWLTARG